jgi:Cu+-exporting ATPase
MEGERIFLDKDIKKRADELFDQGKTLSFVAVDDKLIGIIAVADTMKPNVVEVVKRLKEMGIEVIMITGDNKRTAEAVAKKAGIDRYFAEVLPDEKSNLIKKLQREGKIVAMVGDGINDAPALAQSDVGIAVGGGTDVALEAGGIVLVKDDLRDVVASIQLSKQTVKKIKQNLFWAFFYNAAFIPVAAGALYPLFKILLSPVFAAVAMSFSSVTVVANSLSLRKFTPALEGSSGFS